LCVCVCAYVSAFAGWQDTGSVIRVHASSSLQPDSISVFEAEQLVLAPGDWVPDALSLFGLKLDVQVWQRARPAPLPELFVHAPCA